MGKDGRHAAAAKRSLAGDIPGGVVRSARLFSAIREGIVVKPWLAGTQQPHASKAAEVISTSDGSREFHSPGPSWTAGGGTVYPRHMPQRRFPRTWRFQPIPGGYRVIDTNASRWPRRAGAGQEQGQELLQAQPLRSKPVMIGDLIREGKLLEVHCANC